EREEQRRSAPLADRMRPQTIAGVVGQEHLLGEGAPLRVLFGSRSIPSVILWGPPGVGKTTIANLMAIHTGAEFTRISAIESGVKELREIIATAERSLRRGIRTILFIDEIHRFNKSQQDALLHAVEKGYLALIGATTENPSFEVNAALLSRCRVYRLRALDAGDIRRIIEHAITHDDVLKTKSIRIDAWDMLIALSGGDARTALNALDVAVSFAESQRGAGGEIHITRTLLETVLQQKTAQYDKKGENHYDTVSAFIKTMRGSDPDAALYWLSVMLEAGEDPLFIARRMIIFASEDIGNANPLALQVALSVFRAAEIIGMPEVRINLAQGVTYLAASPKSNASYMGIEAALALVRQGADTSVPLHLRNGVTTVMKKEGYGSGYQYPHSFTGGFVREEYFPSGMERTVFYKPEGYGDEAAIKERLEQWWGGSTDENTQEDGTK
ncbi:MAG: replication-associated recombination protein A, partial [Candidatus Kapabacteria bacterium]|nr:replication-associated recombination protein A [Candidatus Kapabacteria bacterium]